MRTTHHDTSNQHKTPAQKSGWNLVCDAETHEALDILGAYYMGKEKMPDELKGSLKIPKTKVIKVLAFEKLKALKLIKSEVSKA